MKKAMTLAEVLIVLTIIGVTFVLSMPVLNNYFKNNDNKTRLKKVQMILDDFVGRSEIVNGPMDTWPMGAAVGNMYTNFWPKYMQPFFTSSKICSNMYACGYPSNFNSSKWQDASWGLSSGSSRVLFQLMDGTVIFWPLHTTDANGNPAYVEHIYVDVNGPKAPNTFCKDVFPFTKNYDKNTIVPRGCTIEYLTTEE